MYVVSVVKQQMLTTHTWSMGRFMPTGQLIQCIKAKDPVGLQAALDAGADEVLESAGPAGLTAL